MEGSECAYILEWDDDDRVPIWDEESRGIERGRGGGRVIRIMACDTATPLRRLRRYGLKSEEFPG